MSYSPVGDTVAIINIAWQIYNKIYVVARDAPQEYRTLLADLRVFSDQLKTIRARFESSDDAPTEPLREVLQRSSQTLVDFKEKLAKYSDLGVLHLSTPSQRISLTSPRTKRARE